MIDPFGRKIELLRVSVTDKCNYRCLYCMPPDGVEFIPHEEILRFEEIRDIVSVGVKFGINKIRLTGGEPLVRKGITELVRMLASIAGLKELAMTTNGSLLAPLASDLAQSGLQRVNISLDTLDPIKFNRLTRGGNLNDVLLGIDAAVKAGLTPIKLNIVVDPDEGDTDARMVEKYGQDNGFITRRIRKMDIRKGIFSVVENSDRGNCKCCNRLRLTSNGYIRCCLLSDIMFDVRKLGTDEAIRRGIVMKPKKGIGTRNSSMSSIGG